MYSYPIAHRKTPSAFALSKVYQGQRRKKQAWPLAGPERFLLTDGKQLIKKFIRLWKHVLPAMKRLVENLRNAHKSPLQTVPLTFIVFLLCASQTAIKLTHILAFCVYIQHDDVCKQWKKTPPSAALRSREPFPLLRCLSLDFLCPPMLPSPRPGAGGAAALDPLHLQLLHLGSLLVLMCFTVVRRPASIISQLVAVGPAQGCAPRFRAHQNPTQGGGGSAPKAKLDNP